MNFSQDTSEQPTFIHSYHEDYLVISQRQFKHHCLLHCDGLINPWQPEEPLTPALAEFQPLLDLNPELIILGTGQTLIFPDNQLRHHINEQGIGLEIMDTGAACRTYNLLLTEGRNVAAAILLNQQYR